MFINQHLGEIFIINKHTGEIHAASRMSGSCNLGDGFNPEGAFTVSIAEDFNEGLNAYKYVSEMTGTLDFCGHCFPDLSKK